MLARRALLLLLATSALGAEPGALTRERLVSLSTAASAIRMRDARYPSQEQLDWMTTLIVPAYVRDLPYRDEWGTPFRYTLSEDGAHLTIASAGPNRHFDSCGDDLAVRDGAGVCPASKSLAVTDDAVERAAAKLTMMELRAISGEVESYKSRYHALPESLDAVERDPSNGSPIPRRDAWGRPYGYERTAGRSGYHLSDGRGEIVYDGSQFVKAPRGLAGALDRLVWPADVAIPALSIKIGGHVVSSSETLQMNRATYLQTDVVVTAPPDDADIEEPRYPANLEVTARSRQNGRDLRAHVTASGSGGSQVDRWCSLALDLRESVEVRRARLKEFFAATARQLGISQKEIPVSDVEYIANPAGTYDVTVSYRPSSGAYAGRVLTQTFTVNVTPGPDSLDLMMGH